AQLARLAVIFALSSLITVLFPLTGGNWPAARRLERDEDRLSVFISKRVAYIVPRRVFADASAFDAF
ncbi:MAG: hypothetical protein M3N02_07695, partial [Pseudomonadota bacterium]|nr:hypothetical protein [Pseudomonadota bacterium]